MALTGVVVGWSVPWGCGWPRAVPGGAVGTGLEWKFAPGWSVGVEYDHLFMGNRDLIFTSPVAPIGIVTRTENIKQDVDMGTVRLNYTFGAAPVFSRY